MLFYEKSTFMSHICVVLVVHLVACAQKVLSGLQTNGTWISESQVTANPHRDLTSSGHRSINPVQALATSASPSSDLTFELLNTRPRSTRTWPLKTTFTSLQPLTNVFPVLSAVELPKNIKRSTSQDDLVSPMYEFMSKLSPSTQIILLKNITTTTPLKEFPSMQQSTVMHSNTQADQHQSQHPSNTQADQHQSLIPSNYEDQSILISDVSEARLDFGDLIQTRDSQNNTQLVNTSQEQDMLTWFDNVRPGLRKSQDVNVSNSALENETFPEKTSPENHEPCNEDCTKNQRVCVMGSDFKPHCAVADNSCQQMRCVSGECVSKDGLHKCECNTGWVGTFCEKPCTLDCGENGKCGHIDHNSTVGCICHWNYTGHRCQEKKKLVSTIIEVAVPGEDFKVWETAVAVVIAVVVLAMSCILLPYLLWRRQWVPMRELVFYFQEFEDNDNKEYDAFISYTSTPSDEKFVLRHLYPKLEKELQFKLCLHFRDFPPGEPIANNIIRAIEGSRRTILILSPSFISSEWCRMEYQKAQYEMLRLKHKIIPIIVEDIADVPEIDKNLKTIIDTVTYITWPGDEQSASSRRLAKFWKLLVLSMPKRRPEFNRGISTSESCSSEVPLTAICDASSSSGISSLNEDDFLGISTSRSGSNASSSSTTEGCKCSSIDPPCFSNGLQLQVETECGIPLTPPLATRHEVNNIGNSESDNEEELRGKLNQTSQVVERVIKNTNSSGGEREKHNVSTTEQTNNAEQQLRNIFQTSDDHIVEIREAGPGDKRLTIKPRSRQLPHQLFV